jgi:hypothetical protein
MAGGTAELDCRRRGGWSALPCAMSSPEQIRSDSAYPPARPIDLNFFTRTP